MRAVLDRATRRASIVVGGQARLRVIALLAGVLSLVAADLGTVGAVGVEIKQSLGLSNAGLGSLIAVPSAAGALAVLPVGVLTDRLHRVRFLATCIVLWSLAMVVGGLADSLSWLLLSRVALGALTAAAGPTVASLVGDFFPPGERGRIYGFILSGETLGAGFGLVVGSAIAHFLSWRAAFWFLALLGLIFVFVITRHLPEPKRGGQSRLPEVLTSRTKPAGGAQAGRDDAARRAVRRRGIGPDPALVLRHNPARMSLWRATRYVLSIRTNVVLIAASVIGYFFFAGLRTFAVVFVHEQYGLGQAGLTGMVLVLGVGALLGVLSGGRVADGLTHRGYISARLVVPAVAYVAGAAFFVPGLLTTSVVIALPFLLVSAASMAAALAPLDAARLDVMHSRLWGRAESVRTFLRVGAEAVAPLTFGLLADVLGPSGTTSAQGLRYTFLIMLVPLVTSAIVLLHGRYAYPRDVATAAASERMTGADRRRVQ
ncbi:Predicted arabinose efflux permease, MFS family [Nonomuraea jiangxiensis]|uniref:Predicted arabinose efflux permease, MFS family n=2 Tax=Nonomuraea jiangxiensis TaxID=633440 RepID=A0A1G9PBY8_9ACTN|nr:Predicted arabinose efflux permease, MFS family [Nonomuraea jiangxiensis]